METKKKSHAINCTGKIDNISLVFSGFYPELDKIYQSRIINLWKSGVLKPVSAKNGFKRNYKLQFDHIEHRILLSMMPVKENGPTFRLDFNPSKLGANTTSKVLLFIADKILSDGAKELYQHARVSRVDIAFDLYGFSLCDAHFWCDKVSSSQTYNGHGMRTQTLVFNQSKRRQVVVYDKAAEQLRLGIQPKHTPWTRVEVRKRNAGHLANLKTTNCPMLEFHISRREKPDKLSYEAWVLLNSGVGVKNLQSVLGQLPMSKKANLVHALGTKPLEAWDPKKIWKSWPNIVLNSGLLLPPGCSD